MPTKSGGKSSLLDFSSIRSTTAQKKKKHERATFQLEHPHAHLAGRPTSQQFGTYGILRV